MLVRSHIPPTRGTSEGRRKQHSRRQRSNPQPPTAVFANPSCPHPPLFLAITYQMRPSAWPSPRLCYRVEQVETLSALDLPGLSSSFAISESAKAFIHVRKLSEAAQAPRTASLRNLSEALHASTRATFTMQWVCTTTTCATYLNSCTGTFISLRWT